MENLQQVVVGGGCFWCVEAVMQRLKGVARLESGYCGGSQPNPTYREVCSGMTSHAEVVRITFDPKVISLHDLLTIFMTTHDPTTLNRQGNDKGTQYRSIVFYQDDAQKATILQVFDAIKHIFPDPIVTEVSPAMPFYPAEDYHQNYYNDNPVVPYCRIVISPKVEKLRHYYSAYLKGQS